MQQTRPVQSIQMRLSKISLFYVPLGWIIGWASQDLFLAHRAHLIKSTGAPRREFHFRTSSFCLCILVRFCWASSSFQEKQKLYFYEVCALILQQTSLLMHDRRWIPTNHMLGLEQYDGGRLKKRTFLSEIRLLFINFFLKEIQSSTSQNMGIKVI